MHISRFGSLARYASAILFMLELGACADEDINPNGADAAADCAAADGAAADGAAADGRPHVDAGAGGSATPGDALGAWDAGPGDSPGADGTAHWQVARPEDLTDESNADYGLNQHGLITGAKLKAWVENWPTARPAGVSGKLVVLQVVPAPANSKVHVVGTGTNVVSYLLPQNELTKIRNNGLSQIEAEIPDGPAADALLKKYAIDPALDFIVLTFEQLPAEAQAAATTSGIVQQVGRAWLLLRNWGYPANRIALLNGSVNWNAAHQDLVVGPSTGTAPPPNDGKGSVKQLRSDNTALVITLGELLDTLNGKPGSRPLAKVAIVDARGGAEALGLLKSTSTGKTDCPSYTGTGANARCAPLFEGRIKGAKSVPWPQFLAGPEHGFRFLPKSEIKALFDAQADYTLRQC